MRQPHVLIIDDEPDTTTYLSTVCADQGWIAATANSANDGLGLAKRDVPDVILLDVMMPERGGLSTLIALRKEPATSKVPVVLVTGIQEKLPGDFGGFLDRFKHYHPDAYLEKPIDPKVLIETVTRLLP
jgi:CheY-like chemotaxis protein